MKIATVESFTGGSFAAKIVARPGASKYFMGGLVLYSNESKESFGISTKMGVVNEDVARQMAIAGKEHFRAGLCISFTGNAGPGGLDYKRVGLVFIAFNEKVYQKNFSGSREEIQKQSVNFAWEKLKALLVKET